MKTAQREFGEITRGITSKEHYHQGRVIDHCRVILLHRVSTDLGGVPEVLCHVSIGQLWKGLDGAVVAAGEKGEGWVGRFKG